MELSNYMVLPHALVPMTLCLRVVNTTISGLELEIPVCRSLFTFFLMLVQVRELTQQFPAALPLALIMKKFLADRSLDHPYSGGLSSYCLVCSFS